MTALRIFLLWAAGLGAAAQFSKISVFFPLVESLYASAGAATGFLLTVISLTGALIGLTAGLLSTRIGLRPLLVWALVLGGLLSVVQASLPSFPMMLALRLVEGLSHLAIVVAAPTLILQVSPIAWRGAAMTLWGTFFGVAFAGTALLGTPIVEAFGIGSIFSVHGIWMLVLAAALHFALAEVETRRAQEPISGLGDLVRQHISIYVSPSVAAPALGWLFYTFTFVAALTVLPSYIDAADRLFALTAMPLASIIVSLTLGVLALRFMTAVNLTIGGFCLAILVVGLIGLQGVTAWLAILLLGTLGLVQGASFAAIGELVESQTDRANASGALAQMGNVGNLLGTPVFLFAGSSGGLYAVACIMVAAYCAGMAAHIWCGSRRGGLRA
ncbi:MAG: MFS transporter [Pseudomonadota bacterium]